MSSSIPTTGTKSLCLFCHLGVALPPDGQIGLTCPTPSASASSAAAGAPEATSFLPLGAKEEEALASPKPCIGTQSLPRWDAQRQTERSARLECATHCFTYFLAPLLTNLKVKKALGMKKHKAEEGCRKRLVMYSLRPLDSLVQEIQQDSLPTAPMGCNDSQTSGSGSPIPAPPQCQDKVLVFPFSNLRTCFR